MTPSWKEELARLKSILQKTELEETTKWGMPVFTYKGRNVVGMAGFKTFFALWFYNGIFMEDKSRVLINAQEGVTKAMRQWRFTSGEEIDEKLILAYVQEAIANEKQGKKLRPEKKEALPIPYPLAQAFVDDGAFRKSFEALSQARQNEYVEYNHSAKQEATKLARVEKIRPWVVQGKGLYDKYKK